MTPQEKRLQALNKQTQIEAKYCAHCPIRLSILSSVRTTACTTCHHGHELREVGHVLNETMSDMRLQRSGVIV